MLTDQGEAEACGLFILKCHNQSNTLCPFVSSMNLKLTIGRRTGTQREGGGAATPRGPKFLGAGLQPGLEILDL